MNSLDSFKFFPCLLLILPAFILVAVFSSTNAVAVSCLDNADCQNGEACMDQGICVKRCAPLRLRLSTNGTDSISTSNGDFNRFYLTVTNWQQFPDELFALSSDLPACGLNTNSSRSWIDIYDTNSNSRIYGFCGFTEAKDLTLLWFGVQQGLQPPQKVHVTMDDRRTGVRYCSNSVQIPSN